MDANISIQSQRHVKEKMNRKLEKQKNGTSNNESDDSDLETEDPTAIKHNTITSLAALKQMLSAYGDTQSNQTFFQNYFQNHTNSLPSRSVINCRRLSQCREEDEEEDRKEHVPSSDMSSIISGSDKSLSESSSSDSKTSVIDTVSGPTHKFVITKTKQPSDAANNFVKKTKNYQPAKTVHFPTESDKSRPSVYTIFGKGSLSSPHYDSRFFDSTLIEMRSQTSSSSTIECGSTEDIWIKRVPDSKKVKETL